MVQAARQAQPRERAGEAVERTDDYAAAKCVLLEEGRGEDQGSSDIGAAVRRSTT